MPGRLEFETEFANEAEEAVQHMQFDPGDGINPRTGEVEPEMELKLVVMDIYNSRLTARGDRKKVIFEHSLLEYRKNAAVDKKRTKEERDLLNKAKPFARMMNHADFDAFTSGLEYEHNLRQAIAQLQDWRQMRIGDLKSGEKYEQEKQQRAARPAPTGSFDRFASARSITKPTPPIETPSATTALTAPELPERLKPPVANTPKGPLTSGTANGSLTPSKANYIVPPLGSNSSPRLTNENATDLHLLTKEEVELCNVLRIMPKPYLVIKESLLKEAMKTGGMLKRKAAREVAKVRRHTTSFFRRVGICSGGKHPLTMGSRLTPPKAAGFSTFSCIPVGYKRPKRRQFCGVWTIKVEDGARAEVGLLSDTLDGALG